MKMLFGCATFVFLFLKMLAYSMLYVENGSEVIKALMLDAVADASTIQLTEDNCRCFTIFHFIHFIFQMILVLIVQLYGRLRDGRPPEAMTPEQLVWLYAITLTFIGLKIILRKNCRRSGNTTVRLFAEEHSELVDVAGLVTAILRDRFYWLIDPIGAILVIACIWVKWWWRLLEIYPDVHVGEGGKPAPPGIKTMPESTVVESSSSRTAPQQHFGSIRAAERDIEECKRD